MQTVNYSIYVLYINYVIGLPKKLHEYGLLSGVFGDLLNSEDVQQQMRDIEVKQIIYNQIHVWNPKRIEKCSLKKPLFSRNLLKTII